MLKVIKRDITPSIPAGKKFCKHCKQIKSLLSFPKNPLRKSKDVDKCRECIDSYSKIRNNVAYDSSSRNNRQKIEEHFKNPQYKMFQHARERAREKGLQFSLVLSDIKIPLYCPILAIPLSVGFGRPHDGSPTIDRIDNSKGYTKDNVWVISYKANTIKNNSTLSELKLMVSVLEKLQC